MRRSSAPLRRVPPFPQAWRHARGRDQLARYRLEGAVSQRQRSPFPLSTLIINVSGSTVLGAFVGSVTRSWIDPSIAVWVGTGFIGGYTTFSTFTYETVRLIKDGAWNYVGWNLLLPGR